MGSGGPPLGPERGQESVQEVQEWSDGPLEVWEGLGGPLGWPGGLPNGLVGFGRLSLRAGMGSGGPPAGTEGW